MKINAGSFSAGPQLIFRGVVNWLVGLDRGRLFASTDGIKFLRLPNNIFGLSKSNVNVIERFEDEFWAGSNNGNIAKSTDGIRWTTVNSNFGTGTNNNVNSINYNGGIWVIAGQSSLSQDQIRRSTNGINWTTINSNFANTSVTSVAFNDKTNVWIANGAGNLRLSTDATNWTTVTSKSGKEIYSYDDKFALLQDNQILESTDSITWTTNYLTWITTYSEAGTNLYQFLSYFPKPKYVNNLWMVGINQTFLKSTNGLSWTSVQSNFPSNAAQIGGIAYGNGVWLAVAGSNTSIMRKSTDSINWTTVNGLNLLQQYSQSIAYGNGTWIVPGNRQRWAKTTDLITWTTENINFGNSNASIAKINYDNNIWLFGTNRGQVYRSTDAITWTGKSLFGIANSVNVIEYANNIWIAASENVGFYYKSTDSISWTSHQPLGLSGLTNREGVWYGIDYINPIIKTSTDALNWTTNYHLSNVSGMRGNSLSYANDTWVASTTYSNTLFTYKYRSLENDNFNKIIKTKNNNDIYVLANNGSIYSKKKYSPNWNIKTTSINDKFVNAFIKLNPTSVDIKNSASVWRSYTSNLTSFGVAIYSLNYGQGAWVAGAYRTLSRSTDLINWATVNTTAAGGANYIHSIEYADGKWAATNSGISSYLITSTNSINWTTQPTNLGTNSYTIKYSNGLWVLGGAGQVRISTNLTNWTTAIISMPAYSIDTIEYGNDVWVAGAAVGTILKSTDAITWTTVNSNFGNSSVTKISYGGGSWVGLVYRGKPKRSTNLTTWTTIELDSWTSTVHFRDVTYINNIWIMTGSLGHTRKSTDAIYWTTVLGSQIDTYNLAYGNGLWGSVNKLNTMISDLVYDDEYSYAIIGNNASYRSTDLVSWNTITTLSSPAINQTEINTIITKN